jgi:hypothetical protein
MEGKPSPEEGQLIGGQRPWVTRLTALTGVFDATFAG